LEGVLREKIPASVQKAYRVAKGMRKAAHAPYSKFRVGAALICETEIIGGCNVENASYGATVCAERVAIFRAVAESKVRKIRGLVVVTDAKKPAYPCALCLQVMAEFFSPDTPIWIADTKAIREATTFSELLPRPFGPRELALKL
jgi:cytidine deaminase